MISTLIRGGLIAAVIMTTTASHAQAETKKDLAQKLVQVQRSSIESVARTMAEQPAAQVSQNVRRYIQTQIPPEKREAAAKAAEAEIRKYLDEAIPLLRDKALQLAPGTLGAMFEEKFSEDELKQLITWYESPVAKKYEQTLPALIGGLTQKLSTEGRTLLEPKIRTLDANVGKALGITPPPAANGTPPASAPKTR